MMKIPEMNFKKTFFSVAAIELAWREKKATAYILDHFIQELRNDGFPTWRLKYNTIYSKIAQGDGKKLASWKWLTSNTDNKNLCLCHCLVKLDIKIISRTSNTIKTNRLFLPPNKDWNSSVNSFEYKNTPLGKNEMKWGNGLVIGHKMDEKN